MAGINYLEYDFTEDWMVKNEKLNKEYHDLGIWKKYFTYKMVNTESLKIKKVIKETYPEFDEFLDKVRNYITDPDTNSHELQDIYNELWLTNSLEYCRDAKKRIHGDTMNSIQTTLNWYVSRCYEKDGRYYAGEGRFVDERFQGTLFQSLQIFMDIAEEEREEKFIKEGKNDTDVECLKEFIKYNHTLGNFIPVPFKPNEGSFNAPRYKPTNDFWDLTLYRIYCWYGKNTDMNKVGIEKCDCEKNKDLCDLLGKNSKNVKLCIQWLETFGSWDKFVEDNFLEMYVVKNEDDKDKKYGIPKPLWCNDEKYEFEKLTEDEAVEIWKKRLKKCEKGNICMTTETCEQYFKNATRCIKERTKIMVEKLNKKGKFLTDI